MANVPPYMRKSKDSAYNDVAISIVKHVDNGLNVDKSNMKELKLLKEEGNLFYKDTRTQKLLEPIANRAEERGMGTK